MGKIIDLTGERFCKLIVVNRVENSKYGKVMWYCKCDCGNTCNITSNNLRSGNSKSCGCLQKEVMSERSKKLNEYIITDDYIIAKTNSGIEFYIDKNDEWVLKDYCWHIDSKGYACTTERMSRKCILLHRLILDEYNDNVVIDHINGNPLDNRRENLRTVSYSQNGMNRKISSNNTSGVTGVSFNNQSSKWQAYIRINNKFVYLGRFDNFDDAVSARKAAEEKYFGEYSYNNSRVVNTQ